MSTDRPDSSPDSQQGARRRQPPDEVLDGLLDSERRRRALSILSAADEPLSVAALAGRIVAHERDVAPSSVPEGRRDDVRDQLYEHDVPKLTALRLARFDSMTASIALTDDAEALLERWHERAEAGDLPPPE